MPGRGAIRDASVQARKDAAAAARGAALAAALHEKEAAAKSAIAASQGLAALQETKAPMKVQSTYSEAWITEEFVGQLHRPAMPDDQSQSSSSPESVWGQPSFAKPTLKRVPFPNEVNAKEGDDEEVEEIFSKYQKARERARRQRKRERQKRMENMETEEQMSSDEDDGSNNTLGMQLLEFMKEPGTGWKSQEADLKENFVACIINHLKWVDSGSEPPSDGRQLNNNALAQALEKGQTEFTQKEWEAFGLGDLFVDYPDETDRKHPGFHQGFHQPYIKAGSSYFKPADTPFELPENADMPALIPPPAVGSTIVPTSWALDEDITKERASAQQNLLRIRDRKVDRALETIESGEEELDLSHLNIDDAAAVKCAEKLKTSFGMKKFNISLNLVSLPGALALGEVLARLPKLVSLSFSHNFLGNGGTAALAHCLRASTVLTELDLSHNEIGPEVPAEVFRLTALKTLSLRSNKLQKFPAEILKAIPSVDLEDNPAYLEMFLECELEDEREDANKRTARGRSLQQLVRAWKSWEDLDMPRARELMLNARKEAVMAGGGVRVCSSLVDKLDEADAAIAKRTEALGPSFVRVDDPAQIMVGNAIERVSLKLREGGADISLLNQRVGNVGMTSMAEALAGNSTVTWLDISGCDVGPTGIKALAPWLGKTHVLKTLWIASNPLMGDQGCTELAAGLRTNTTLAKLDLSSCNVGAPGCAEVVKALQANPSLRELRLALNTFGDEGATAVAAALKDMRNLQACSL